jgi:opine dehydrogenase
MAADLTLAGCEVNLCELPAFRESFLSTLETGCIELSGIGRTGTAKLHLATTDVVVAVRDVELIHLVVPASGHDAFFSALLPALTDDHIVVLWPDNFGSLRLTHLLKKKGGKANPKIAGANTLPYGTRLCGPGKVELLLSTPEVGVAALPATETDEVVSKLQKIYPCVHSAPNVLSAAFSNPNPVVHPVASLLNTGRIQYSKGEFYLYREGITEAVARAIRAAYDEVSALAEAFGFGVIRYDERDFRTTASIMGAAFQAPFDTVGVIARILGPKSLQDRYLTEDIPFGLVPMSEFGKKLRVPTPIMDAIIDLGSVICGGDYRRTGYTLSSLGLTERTPEEMIRWVEKGESR